MKVRVRVFGPLKKYLPGQVEDVVIDVPEGATVQALLQLLQVPDEDVYIVTVNKVKAASSQVLNDGDEFAMFSPVGGG